MNLHHLTAGPLAEAGFRVPIWGIPILLVAALGVGWYQKRRDSDR